MYLEVELSKCNEKKKETPSSMIGILYAPFEWPGNLNTKAILVATAKEPVYFVIS